jgi:preprotein translocase subunit SecF
MQFMNKAKVCILISSAVVLIAIIVGFIFGGLNLGIDFTGGSLLTIDLKESFDMNAVNDALQQNGIDPATAQVLRSGETQAVIRMQALPEDVDDAQVREAISNTLKETYPNAVPGQIESVGGATTSDIIRNAFLSILIAAGFMLIYIWIRFELFSGIAAVTALVHDVLIMTAFVCIARIQINSSYIAAVLTIVGYSINDTIVVFDRIRENNKRFGKSKTRKAIADMSITETLPRTINTSATTLITILAVYIFGVQSIKEFALPIIVGLISGTYSSIFIASPTWVALLEAKDRRHQQKISGSKKPVKKAKKAKKA